MNQNFTAPQTTGFLDQLRAHTAAAHQALEQLPLSRSIVSNTVTPAQYAWYLNLMGNVVQDIENHVFPSVAAILPDVGQRLKSGWIASDLKALSWEYAEKPTPFRASFDRAFALGIVYVMEGSTLGGRFILRNIETVLGYTSDRGLRYFSGYGNQTGPYWKALLHAVSEKALEAGNSSQIMAGAQFAFETIHQHLSAHGYED